MQFRSPSDQRLYSLDEVIESLYLSADEHSEDTYTVTVGSDSQVFRDYVVYVTVIVLHRVGKGARMFYWKQRIPRKGFVAIADRITRETALTIEVLSAIENSILIETVGRENLSAHVDAGPDGRSSGVVEPCVGWVTGLGFECQSKPDSFVASHVADKFTK